jgi:hypothetical protein
MINVYVSAGDIAQALGLTKRAIERRAEVRRWPSKLVNCRGGKRRIFQLTRLPRYIAAAIVRWVVAKLAEGELK